MSGYIKSAAPASLVTKLMELENKADECCAGSELMKLPWNYAGWLALAECISQIENAVARSDYGGPSHTAALINTGRIAAILMKWIAERADRRTAPQSKFSLNQRVCGFAKSAFHHAEQYSHFTAVFPGWHCGLYQADVDSSGKVLFRVGASIIDGRVSAYQKGIKPKIH